MQLSRFLLTLSQLILLCNWLIERNFISKWNTLKNSKAFWAFVGIYLFSVIGFLWTSNYEYGLKDLRIKLPMLWLPLLFFTSPPLNKKDYHLVMHIFVLACIVASFCCMCAYFGVLHKKIYNVRDISIFQSHIRFSLMLVLCICYLFFYFTKTTVLGQKLVYLLCIGWILFFLIFLQSFTGLVILGILSCVSIVVFLFSKQTVLFKVIFLLVVASGLVYSIFIIADEYKKAHKVNKIDLKTLPLYTSSGHAYWNDTIYKFTENGNYVYILMCEDELRPAWQRKSKMDYEGLDKRKNQLKYTLIRYMASKGLTRDLAGFLKLNDEDIKHVEDGCPNYLYTNPLNPRSRIHEIFWETDNAMRMHEANGHSLTMRLEFWKTALGIIKEHVLFGVGTGDVEDAFKTQYQKENTSLKAEWQLRSHNQYIEITVALGIVGLFLFLLYVLAPFFAGKKLSVLFLLFILIQVLSFINEDTLETQAGVNFCIFFTQLFFHNDEHNV